MVRLNNFTTLTFDCYGTLIDWERGILAELRPWVNRHGHHNLDDDAILEAFAEAEATCEADTPAKPYPEILEDTQKRLAGRWAINATGDETRSFGQSVGRWPAFADSATSLKYLKRYYKLCVISNVDRASFARSNDRLGVEFDRIVTAQDVKSYKPNIRNFEYALTDLERALGVSKQQILHAAQSIFHDIVPARKVGLATLWINRRKEVGGWGATPAPCDMGDAALPDFEVPSLAEFLVLHQAHLRGEAP
jgi:2-haloacid dehalogenase